MAYRAVEKDGHAVILDDEDKSISDIVVTHDESMGCNTLTPVFSVAKAEEVVRALNCHDDMVEALEHARLIMWECGFSEDDLKPLRDALAKAATP